MSRKRHGLKTFGLAVVACMALSVVVASAAQARSWSVNGSTLVGSTPVTCTSTTGFTLNGTVLGTAVELHATSVDCIENSKIENSGGVGVDSGKLTFTGVTVVKPALGCEVPEEMLTTNLLKTHLQEVAGNTHGFDTFEPASGTEFVTIPIEECLIAGEYPVSGSISGEGEEWGTELVNQPLRFSSTIDAKTGDHLTFGGNAATLTGTAINMLESGLKFGGK